MGSFLGPTLSNVFLVYHEKKWLECCLLKYRPIYYQKYVDHIFTRTSKRLSELLKFLSCQHIIYIAIEMFLDLLRLDQVSLRNGSINRCFQKHQLS